MIMDEDRIKQIIKNLANMIGHPICSPILSGPASDLLRDNPSPKGEVPPINQERISGVDELALADTGERTRLDQGRVRIRTSTDCFRVAGVSHG
jgi:hypothetical protein